jgi:hypothetical protein
MINNSTHDCDCRTTGFCFIYNRKMKPSDIILLNDAGPAGQQARLFWETGTVERGNRKVPQPASRVLVGDELEKLIRSFAKIKTENATCNCKTLKKEMNNNGVAWCRKNIDSKIVPGLLKNLEAIRKDLTAEDLKTKLLLKSTAIVPDVIMRPILRSYVQKAIRNATGKSAIKSQQSSKANREYKKPVELMPVEWNPVKHLIFHIYPVESRRELWQWHLDWILKHKHLFNGRMIIGISVDDKTVNADDVQQYLGEGFEFRVSDNVPRKHMNCCENVTFFDSLETLSDGVCFYAHAKGVTSAKVSDEIARKWSSEMYSHLLGEYSSGMLRHNGAYGTFLTDYNNTAVLSGTFFWFRVAEAKARQWRTGSLYHSVEVWPTLIFQDKLECFAKHDLRGHANIQSLQKPETWERLEKQWGDQKVYQQKLHAAISEAKQVSYPADRFSGRGIVMPAGGWWKLRKPHQPYFWCAYTATSFLRHKGCRLPVQWWFLPGEIDEIGRRIVTKWANRVGATLHETASNVKGGWQVKIHAILNCEFEEVIHLDSDVIAVDDPEKLFDEPGYIQTGVHFWADNPDLVGKFEKCSYVLPSMWDRMGLPRREKIRDIEAGQMVIDKRRAWAALQVDQHFADNAEYWEGFNGGSGGVWYGDKTSHHVACLVTDTPYYREDRFHFVHSQGWYGHKTTDGKVALQHCCHRKGELVNGQIIPGIKEAECVASFGALRKKQERKGDHIGDYRFLHIHKTGGTSLRGSLIAAGMPAWRARHFTWHDMPDTELDLLTITILRDPVDRIISHYNDMMHRWHIEGRSEVPWPHAISLDEFRQMSVVEFAEYDAHGISANLQTQVLGPTLEEAKRHLTECEYVFETNRLSQQVGQLEQRISRSIFLPRSNERPRGGLKRTDLTTSVIDKITELACLDYQLLKFTK